MSYEDESRSSFTRASGATLEDLKFGCLQRIATACEAMAKNYIRLQESSDAMKQRLADEQDCNTRLMRRNIGLRGALTRIKNKGAANANTKKIRR